MGVAGFGVENRRRPFFISEEITSYEIKNAPRGCALARSRNMSQATALGARMCQGTFFFMGKHISVICNFTVNVIRFYQVFRFARQ